MSPSTAQMKSQGGEANGKIDREIGINFWSPWLAASPIALNREAPIASTRHCGSCSSTPRAIKAASCGCRNCTLDNAMLDCMTDVTPSGYERVGRRRARFSKACATRNANDQVYV